MPQTERPIPATAVLTGEMGLLSGVSSGSGVPRDAVRNIRVPQAADISRWESLTLERFRVVGLQFDAARLAARGPAQQPIGLLGGQLVQKPFVGQQIVQKFFGWQQRAPQSRPIEDVLAELAAEVPIEEWKKLPDDLTSNLDHYIYGTPKR